MLKLHSISNFNFYNMKKSSLIKLAFISWVSMNSLTAFSAPFSFGLWGDMPYAKAGDGAKLPAVLKSINAAKIDFSIFVGDIKDGSSKCTDDVYTNAIQLFDSMSRPVVYIPGDNEWTDCHRLNNGGYDSQERLAHIRKVMFTKPFSFGPKGIALESAVGSDSLYVENKRFSKNKVMFVTLNIPGSNNNKILDEKDCKNKSARTPLQCEQGNAEYTERDAANIAWMQSSFQKAKGKKSRGIVLAFQGDPGFDLPETEDLDESKAPIVSGYQAFLQAVVKETENFDGQVLLVHGDTHFFKVDKPLYSPTKILPNLTRLQTFGSPNLHWVKVTVDGKRQNVFDIEPVMIQHDKP
jgi:hypothetical protein